MFRCICRGIEDKIIFKAPCANYLIGNEWKFILTFREEPFYLYDYKKGPFTNEIENLKKSWFCKCKKKKRYSSGSMTVAWFSYIGNVNLLLGSPLTFHHWTSVFLFNEQELFQSVNTFQLMGYRKQWMTNGNFTLGLFYQRNQNADL